MEEDASEKLFLAGILNTNQMVNLWLRFTLMLKKLGISSVLIGFSLQTPNSNNLNQSSSVESM